MRSIRQAKLSFMILLYLVIITPADAKPSQLDRIEDKLNKLQDDVNLLKNKNPSEKDTSVHNNTVPVTEQKIKIPVSSMTGTWIFSPTGDKIRIDKDGTFFSQDSGVARMSETNAHGANIVVTGHNFECFYEVSVSKDLVRSNWRAVDKKFAQCIGGSLDKIE